MKIKSLIISLLSVLAVSACMNSKPYEPEKPEDKDLAAPTGVAVSGVAGTTTLGFQWSAVTGATQYRYRLLKGNTEDKTGTVSATSVSFDGLTPDTVYKFDVCAVSGSIESSWSTRIEARTKAETKPDTPADPASRYAEMKIPACEEDGAARAFPGAEGGGMYTTGGRGGKVYHVTKLSDDGSNGTLRYGIEKADRPLTIVFDVAGTIALSKALVISKGDLTIAGQTAPGDGICIRDRYTQVKADNVIIRFIRFRLGDEGAGAGDGDDCIWGRYLSNLVLDHCSMSWSIDEGASFYANSNMTMQWCIIGESMKQSIHSKDSHGYGGIWGGENASFHHNILAHHDSRNPRFDHPHIYENHVTPAHRGVVDFRNNVIYDWGSNNSYGGEGYGAGKGTGINMVGNTYKPGPSSTDRRWIMDAYGVYTSTCSTCGKKDIDDGYPLLYLEGNTHTKYSDISADNALGIYWHNGESHANHGTTAKSAFPVKGPSGQTCHTTTHSASEALSATCQWAGASLSRDKVDERIAGDVRDGKGKIIKDIADVRALYGEAWPEYRASEEQKALVKDSDGDGMPDWFEDKYGLAKSDPADGSAKTIDTKGRYTNLEMYLHYLVKDITAGQAAHGTYRQI